MRLEGANRRATEHSEKHSTTYTSFDLHKLGWKAFEDLTACIFREIMGQTFQSFSVGPDGGRDGAFCGEWKTQDGEVLSGTFTIQCKHSSKSERSLSDSLIRNELSKIRRLSANGLVDNYIFVTNLELSAGLEETARNAFIKAGAGTASVFGPEWINAQISENPRLRRHVPRLFGLGDLTQIVTHQAFRQARELLDSLAPALDCFVPTEAYQKCARALREHGFVLLLGEPASGKTMIANLMALSAADEWELQTFILSGPEDLNRRWNPDDPGQFFWVDDAFGSTQYDPSRVREWNQRLPLLKTAIGRGARAIFTSRDYIFNAALNELKSSSFELFKDSRVIIEVEKLTESERQQILYNHLKCGKQSRKFRSSVKPWLAEAAATPKFLPEIARRFADPKFTNGVLPRAASVKRFFDEPVEWLEDVLLNLAPAEKAAIAIIFIEGGRIPIPVPEEDRILKTILTMRSTIGDVKAALNSLNGSLVRRSREDGRECWRFSHPTVRDAFASLVGSDPELVDIYLAGVPTERLLNEVSCGEMSIEGVKIIVSAERFHTVLKKLKMIKRNLQGGRDSVGWFLSQRCSGEFLKRYFTEIEEVASLPSRIQLLNPFDNALGILCRLNEKGFLPEPVRLLATEEMRKIATRYHSCGFLDDPISSLLTVGERANLIAEMSDILFSNQVEIVEDIRSNWDGESDPDDWFSDLNSTLDYFTQSGTEEERSQAEEFLEDIHWAISEMSSEQRDPPEFSPLEAEEMESASASPETSIFDDVDE